MSGLLRFLGFGPPGADARWGPYGARSGGRCHRGTGIMASAHCGRLHRAGRPWQPVTTAYLVRLRVAANVGDLVRRAAQLLRAIELHPPLVGLCG